MDSIASRLVFHRRQRGLSQVGLAASSGVSQQLISQIESGTNLSTKHLPALAASLGVPLTALDPALASVMPPTLTNDERELIDRYRSASDRQRAAILALLEGLIPEPGAPREGG